MPKLEHDGEVYVLDLGDGENRFTKDWLVEVEALLSEIEATDGPKALVTVARGKIWSNGLDLDWMIAGPGMIVTTALVNAIATATPIKPPVTESSILSVSNCRNTLPRDAPMDMRSAISREREVARAICKFATFAHAISSRNPTAPNSSCSVVRISPLATVTSR